MNSRLNGFQYIFSSHTEGKSYNRSCERCREINEEKYRFDKRVVGENFPPLHPKCRSLEIYKSVNLDDVNLKPKQLHNITSSIQKEGNYNEVYAEHFTKETLGG